MTLWLLMAALAAATVFWLTRPLWWRSRPQAVARRAANVLAYETRLAELQRDVEAGVTTAEQAAALEAEQAARLLDDAAAADDAPAAASQRQGLLTGLFALGLAAFAGAWYWQAGSWQTAERIAAGPSASPLADGQPSEAEIEGMVSRLAERLAANPDDAEGWAMLGRSYFVMNRHADAAKAYAEANTRSASQNADWLVGEGEALAIARDRDLLGRPAQLFEAALALQPGYGKALWYGALADGQSGNTARASERLRRLLQQDLPEELRGIVQARLDEMQGAAPRATAQADPPATAPPAAPAVATGARLVVQVSVAPALAAQLPANATLFVFAKAAGGPPMPLAVQRLPGARLPLTVTLDDSMGMTPAMTLSQFERYVITARLSSSGNAQAVSGDLEGSAEAQRGGDSVVAVEINRTVP